MRLLLETALTDGSVQPDVVVDIDGAMISAVGGAADGAAEGAERVPGLTIPGLANCHSHAFHRALRGRTQRERGTFWQWREQMYALASTLDPDSYYSLAKAVYAEMLASGFTSVGEFHYLHHQPDGTPYADSGAMGDALIAAADEVGIRICLLDTAYFSSGFGAPPEGVQRRFADADVDAWAARASTRNGVAIHSVRAVDPQQCKEIAALAGDRPLHVHLSEQVAENDGCRAAHGASPTQVLAGAGALGRRTSVVHATHLSALDIGLLGASGTHACFCPTTERDLGDGIGPSRRLHDAGVRLTIGSDSHAVIDPFEEMRAVELNERLASQQRGHWQASELLEAATTTGHASLGFPDSGRIAVGMRADLVTLDLTSPRTAGCGSNAEAVVFAASAADVRRVVAAGRLVFDGDSDTIGRQLDHEIDNVWRRARD